MEPEGYVVKTESDPTKAVQLVREESPDCVVLDVKMPKIDGIDVLDGINALGKNTKVIIVTGYGNIENAMESMKLGAYDYITKPFDLGFLKNLIKQCVMEKKK
jgi:two-component system response regulator AtoC